MTRARLLPLLCALFSASAMAQVEPVAIRVPEPRAWTGQRLPFFVDLRARGSFAGAASFSLPPIPRTVVIKAGDLVVSSQEFDGETWAVQSHEFALFSQQTGSVEIPAWEVRFGSRDGFTGPVTDQRRQVPGTVVEIQRPPGSEQFGFLVATESIDIAETWDPQPGAAEPGAVFQRTISQRAEMVTGMALAPPPTAASAGVRVYLGPPEVQDIAVRGNFVGERRDTMIYLVQAPGRLTVPAITYVWWNPTTEQLRSQTLPAVTFEVALPATDDVATTAQIPWSWWLTAASAIGVLAVWQRRRIAAGIRRCGQTLNPPHHVAARMLRRACRRHDAAAAEKAWAAWLAAQDAAFEPGPTLRAAVLDMQRHLYGPTDAIAWRGNDLKDSFRQQQTSVPRPSSGSALPPLNPQ